MAAIRERLGDFVGSDQLIRAALDALLAGLHSPALAGLGRSEEPEAHDLFTRVIDELDLAPTLPNDPTAARWGLVRCWCQLIVDDKLAPEVGGRLIWLNGFNELNGPDALRPIVGWVSEWEDWNTGWTEPRENYRDRITDAAKQLLEQTLAATRLIGDSASAHRGSSYTTEWDVTALSGTGVRPAWCVHYCDNRMVDVGRLLDDLCVRFGYCLPPETRQGIIADPPPTVDAFTDAVIDAEGLGSVLVDKWDRLEVQRIVAAAFGEPIPPAAPQRRRSWSHRG